MNKPSIALFLLKRTKKQKQKTWFLLPAQQWCHLSLTCKSLWVAAGWLTCVGFQWGWELWGEQRCSCCLCSQQGIGVIQAEPSMSGSCLVDKRGLCFPVILLERIWNGDIRDKDVEQQIWGVWSTCPTRKREDYQGAMVISRGNWSHRPCLYSLLLFQLNWGQDPLAQGMVFQTPLTRQKGHSPPGPPALLFHNWPRGSTVDLLSQPLP